MGLSNVSAGTERLIVRVLEAARSEGPLGDCQIRASAAFQEIASLDRVQRSKLLVSIFECIGEIGRSMRPQAREVLTWLALQEHAEFRWCALVADELLRHEVSLTSSDWTRLLSHVAAFDALLAHGQHSYLRPLTTRLEKAAEIGALAPSAARELLAIALSLESAGGSVGTEFALSLRVLARRLRETKPKGEASEAATEVAIRPRIGEATGKPRASAMTHLLERWLRDSLPRYDSSWGLGHLKDLAIASEIDTLTAASAEELTLLATELVERVSAAEAIANPGRAQRVAQVHQAAAWSLLERIVPRANEFSVDALDRVLLWSARDAGVHWLAGSVEAALFAVVERRAAGSPLSDAMRTFLEQIILRWGSRHKPKYARIAAAKTLLGQGPVMEIDPGEAWSDAARADLHSMEDGSRADWMSLIAHCKQAEGAKPTGKWARSAAQLVSSIGPAELAKHLVRWFPLVDRPRTQPHIPRHQYEPDHTHLIIDPHMNILRGLCWIGATIQDPDIARALGRLAVSCYRKVPGVGPRAVKVGNAAVHALGQMPGMDAVGQLAMLRVKVKFGTAQKGIEKALAAAAAREGLPREEMDELGVPSYGLTDVGVRVEEMGEFEARLTVTGIGSTELKFVRREGKGAGKVQKSVPAAVKTGFAEELKDLKAAAKDVAGMLPAQRDRIDSLFLEDKSWSYVVWRERYLDHPLVGVIGRRLIWRVSDGEGSLQRSVMWVADGTDGAGGERATGTMVSVDGKRVEIDEASAIVRLWHPIEVERDEVLAWRRFVEMREIRQPFKQAHREVYVLTDAERATGTYSNRFAAHILRQHQFNALCAVRGWKNKLRLLVDDEYPPAIRLLPAWGLRAEYWIEGVGDDFGTNTNEAGVFLYLATDQVRFYAREAGQASAHAGGGGYGPAWGQTDLTPGLPLEEIPALVFSEIMRDVDLFVGVSSVANNPQWNDGGPEGAHRDYWWGTSFGDLSETGAGRKDLLERLLPRLKIAEVCSLEGRFLRVHGKLREYKIHLGSGNILMEPNDQYLCIVPSSRDGAAGGSVFLPFEGDRVMAIILSKAFMLAEDEKIGDGSILSQIRGR